MNAYSLFLTCARCGGDLNHVTAGTDAGTEACAVAECKPCRTTWRVQVFLRPEGDGAATERKRRSRQAVVA